MLRSHCTQYSPLRYLPNQFHFFILLLSFSAVLSSCQAARTTTDIDSKLNTQLAALQSIVEKQSALLSLAKGFDPSALSPGACRNETTFWIRSLYDLLDAFRFECPPNDTQCADSRHKNLTENFFAVKQVDSFGKIPAGVLDANVLWMGAWDECLEITAPADPKYDTQFCYVGLGSTAISQAISASGMGGDAASPDPCAVPLLIQWSVCVPKSCSNAELTKMFVANVNNRTNGMLAVCSTNCIPESGPKENAAFYIVCLYCAFGAALLVVGGLVDYVTEHSEKWAKYRNNTWVKCLLTFSIYTNGASILDQTKKPGQINCLDCMRTVSMTWVICGHVMANFVSADNPLKVVDSAKYFLNDAFLNAFFSVDTFFFIGGVLLAYVFFQQMQKKPQQLKSPIYWILYYVHRYLRLSPPYFLFIGVTAALQEHLTHGPMNLNFIFGSYCAQYWWKNVLYINNLFDLEKECMGQTWYLAVDWQIHVFSPLLIVPLFLSLKAGCVVAFLLIALSTVANYITFYHFDSPASYVGLFGDAMNPEKTANYTQNVYFAPWLRFTPYVIGVFTGYFLQKTRGKQLHLHWAIAVALWIASILTGIACVYGLYDYLQGPEHEISLAARSSYYNWSRIAWALALAWVVIACQNDWAGPIKNFMEQGFWMPFGRLTYCAYLTHYVIVDIQMSLKRQPLHFVSDAESYINYAIPAFATSYGFAFIWSCMFELSFMRLTKMAIDSVVGGGKKEGHKHEHEHEQGHEHEDWQEGRQVHPEEVTHTYEELPRRYPDYSGEGHILRVGVEEAMAYGHWSEEWNKAANWRLQKRADGLWGF